MKPRWSLWTGLVWIVLGWAGSWLSAANLLGVTPGGGLLDFGGTLLFIGVPWIFLVLDR